MRLRMLILPAVASVALLAGCTGTPAPQESPTPTTNGVEDMEADAILEAAKDATISADSVHVEGGVTEGDTTLTLDVVFAGANMKGTVETLGVPAEIIKIGSDIYVMTDTSLFEQFLPPEQQALLPLLEGKWIKVDEATAVLFVAGVPFSIEDFFTLPEPLEKGEVSTVDGTQVITVTDAEGGEAQVAIEGEPYLLALNHESGGFTFSEFDEEVTIEAPAEEDVLDVMELLGQG